MKTILLAEDTISAQELEALGQWVQSGQRLTKGPLCLRFEKEFAAWQGAEHAVFVSSGSSANLLMAAALSQGGYLRNKIAVAPAVSWCTTVTPFLQLGFDVHLCDCSPNNLGLDASHFRRLCAEYRPSAAILVHVLGHACDMAEILEICDEYDVLLVEDACEALGSVYAGKKCGSFGKCGSFSFYYGHHMSTIEGGMVVTDDDHLYDLLLSIRSHGWARDVSQRYHDELTAKYRIDPLRDLYTFYHMGYNLRSTDLNAWLGLSQLRQLDGIVRKRSANHQVYRDNLKEFWTQESNSDIVSLFAYGVLVENRSELYEHLRANNIECRPLICGNIGLHPFWVDRFGESSFPTADAVHNNGVYLPNHCKLEDEDIAHICEVFKKVARPYDLRRSGSSDATSCRGMNAALRRDRFLSFSGRPCRRYFQQRDVRCPVSVYHQLRRRQYDFLGMSAPSAQSRLRQILSSRLDQYRFSRSRRSGGGP